MKLKTASLLAIIGTSVVLTGSILNCIHNLTVAGHIPPSYLLALGTSLVFEACLLNFFVTLYRNQ